MIKVQKKTIDLIMHEPQRLSMRDLSKIIGTLNNLYNYYSFVTEPQLQAVAMGKIKRSRAKNKKTLVYSSSLEQTLGKANRMTILTISRHSPLKISLSGIGSAIDALRRLIEMMTPFYWMLKKIEKDFKKKELEQINLDIKIKEVELSDTQRKNVMEHLRSIAEIKKMDMSDELKEHLINSLIRNLYAIEKSPIKPMLSGS